MDKNNIPKAELQENIEHIVTEIRDCKADIENLEACVRDLKEKLRDQLEQYGENWSDDSGYARLVSEGERISYNTDALDNLLIEDPLRYGWLKDYRVKSPIASRIQVK